MVRKIEDEFSGSGTISTRFYNRRLKSGLCSRCKEPVIPGRTIGKLCSEKLKAKYKLSKEVSK